MTPKRDYYLKCLSISLLSLICYWMTIFGDIVFDDTEAILKNNDVMGNTPLSGVFSNDFWGTNISDSRSHKSYRPLTVLTFRVIRILDDLIQMNFESIDDQKSGYIYHSFNIIIYIILNIVVFNVFKTILVIFCENDLKLIKTNQRNAFLATILFTCHPIHSEVVSLFQLTIVFELRED